MLTLQQRVFRRPGPKSYSWLLSTAEVALAMWRRVEALGVPPSMAGRQKEGNDPSLRAGLAVTCSLTVVWDPARDGAAVTCDLAPVDAPLDETGMLTDIQVAVGRCEGDILTPEQTAAVERVLEAHWKPGLTAFRGRSGLFKPHFPPPQLHETLEAWLAATRRQAAQGDEGRSARCQGMSGLGEEGVATLATLGNPQPAGRVLFLEKTGSAMYNLAVATSDKDYTLVWLEVCRRLWGPCQLLTARMRTHTR